MELQEAVKGYEEQLLKSLQESIRIRSVQGEASEQYPYGKGVQDCLDHALKTAEALGFATIDLDHQMGWCEYGEGEEMVAVLGHLDVVPEGDGWSFDPFGGEIRDGKVFGRGAMDDKGPTLPHCMRWRRSGTAGFLFEEEFVFCSELMRRPVPTI